MIELKNNWSIAKKYFPEFSSTSGFILLVDDFYNQKNEVEEFWKKIRQIYEKIKNIYNFVPTNKSNLYEWEEFLKDENINKITSDLYITTWKGIAKYPKLKNQIKEFGDIIKGYGFFSNAIDFFDKCPINALEFDNFLSIFGLNLTHLPINSYRSNINYFPKYISSLIGNSQFKNSIQRLLNQSSYLKQNMNFSLMLEITEMYLSKGNIDDFIMINTEINQYGIQGADFQTDYAKEKQELLHLLSQNNISVNELIWDKFVYPKPYSINWEIFPQNGLPKDKEDQNEIINKFKTFKYNIKKGLVKSCINAAKNVWGIEKVKLSTLTYIFAIFEEREKQVFFSDVKKAQRCKEAIAALRINFDYEESLMELNINYNELLIFEEKHDQIMQNKDKLHALFIEGQDNISFDKVAQWLENPAYTDAIFLDLAKNLKDNHNFSISDLHDLAKKPDYTALAKKIENQTIWNNFSKIRNLRKQKGHDRKDSKGVDLLIAYFVNENKNGLLILEKYIENFPFRNWNKDILYLTQVISAEKEIQTLFTNPQFFRFAKKTQKTFSNLNFPKDIAHIADLYIFTKKNPNLEKIFFSPKFIKVHDYLVKNFYFKKSLFSSEKLNKLPFKAYRGILQIAENFDKEKFEKVIKIIESQGDKVYPNDFVLIAEIIKSPELFEMIKKSKRKEVIASIQNNLYGNAVKRTKFGGLNGLKEELSIAKSIGLTQKVKSLENKIKKFNEYTERPDLNSIPILHLIRAKILLKTFKSPIFKKTIGEMISRDIHDNTTEYGGIIYLYNNKITINNIASYSEKNGYYKADIYGYFSGGIISYHFHALSKNERQYSGSSGFQGLGGDFFIASANNYLGLVFTPLDHPQGKNGNKIKNKLIINFDMYFTDKRNDEPKNVDLDLGTFKAPYYKNQDK